MCQNLKLSLIVRAIPGMLLEQLHRMAKWILKILLIIHLPQN